MTAHLWAIRYEDMQRAQEVCDEIIQLGWGAGRAGRYLLLDDVAVVVRRFDGTFMINRQQRSGLPHIVADSVVGFVAGLVLAHPLTGATLGALLGAAGTAATIAAAGISDDFVRDVESLMKPGTSALFVLDDEGDLEVILHKVRGLGGTVLKTNVDLERTKLIQSALSASVEKIEGDKA